MTPLINAILQIALIVLNMVFVLIMASVIVGWIGDRSHQVVRMIEAITEPMYRPMRRFTSRIPGPIDWAPLIASLVVVSLQIIINSYLKAGSAVMPGAGG